MSGYIKQNKKNNINNVFDALEIHLCLVAKRLSSINSICGNKNLHLLNKGDSGRVLFHLDSTKSSFFNFFFF